MTVIVSRGDLFKVKDKYSFVHCASLDCVMGAGIARVFVARYPGMKEHCLRIVKEKNINYPCCIPYEVRKGKFVFTLITKPKYYSKPTLVTLKQALVDLRKGCEKNEITHLAMPKIGCGLDKLDWNDVHSVIEEVFKGTSIEIVVMYL